MNGLTSSALRVLANALTGAGRNARLSILIYHRVLPERDPLLPEVVHAELFDAHMAMVAETFNVVPLAEAAERLQHNSLPRRSLCITFDDGYRDNVEVALPILRRHGLAATFFVTTGYLQGQCMWNDTIIESVRRAPGNTLDLSAAGLDTYAIADIGSRRTAIDGIIAALKYRPAEERAQRVKQVAALASQEPPESDLMMRPADVRHLADDGMEIGGHTASHPILTSLPRADARAEIVECKAELETIIGERVSSFAYPNGRPDTDYTAEHVALVKQAGYRAAVSTAWGVARPDTDPFQLPRFTPWDTNTHIFSLRLLHNCLRNGRSAVQDKGTLN